MKSKRNQIKAYSVKVKKKKENSQPRTISQEERIKFHPNLFIYYGAYTLFPFFSFTSFRFYFYSFLHPQSYLFKMAM